jgi:hypothetical protein
MSTFTKAVDRELSGMTNESSGICPGCDDCPDTEEGFFSWSACEVCGSTLGGNRYPVHARDSDGNIVHFDACEDCYTYIATGEDPTQ